MPMPKGTYLQSKKPDKTTANVATAKDLKASVEQKQKDEFERLLSRKKVDLKAIRKIIDEYKRVADKPKTEKGRQLAALRKALEDLDDLSDLISSSKELQSEVGQPAKVYSSKIKGFDVDTVDLTKFIVAMAIFLMALEKACAKLKLRH